MKKYNPGLGRTGPSFSNSYAAGGSHDGPIVPPPSADELLALWHEATTSRDIEAEVRETLATLFEPGSTVEVRALHGKERTRSGYFDDYDAMAGVAAELNCRGWQVYATLNPVDAALLARAPNRVEDCPKVTTSDDDITRRRWLLIDVDPVRRAGISATLEEKTAAYVKAKRVRDYLREQGWRDPVVADSGSGFHLLYRVDLPNTSESKELIKRVLEALAAEFDDDGAKVDVAVHNAARLVRLYGTVNRKGEPTKERPHRRSEIKKIPEEA